MAKKRAGLIKESLKNLQKDDITSLLLMALYKLRDDPKYAALSELPYILDRNSLPKLLTYYGGMTIKIPTLSEMRLLIEALTLYQYVQLEGGNLEKLLPIVCGTEFKVDDMLEAYLKICEVVGNLDFNRGE